jgi:uncharacterized SAM-binding protein YcdF (DUF218 family)
MVRVILAVVILILLLNPYTLTWMAREYVVDDKLDAADAIVSLRGDPEEEAVRVDEARKLVEKHVAPVLLLDVNAHPYWGHPTLELLQNYLHQRGLPLQQMRACPNTADSTAEEAAALRSCFNQMGFRKVIIVTSEFHTRRARFIFRRVFSGSAIDMRFHPVYNAAEWDVHWWRKRRWAKTTAQEGAKFVWSFLEQWTFYDKPSPPLANPR